MRKNHSNMVIKLFFILILLPPIVGFVVSLIDLINRKENKLSIILVSFFGGVILSYFPPIYDTIHHFDAYNDILNSSVLSWWFYKPFDIAAALAHQYLGLEFYHIVFSSFVLILFFIIKSFKYSNEIISKDVLFISLFILSFRNILGLTVFVLAASIFVWYITRNKIKIWELFLLIIIIYLVHSSVLLILIPSIGLFVLLKRRYWIISFFYCIFFFFILFAILNFPELTNQLVKFQLLADPLDRFSRYSSDSYWGSGYDRKESGTKILLTYIQYATIAISLIIIYLNRKKINNSLLISSIIIGIIIQINVIPYYTLSERFLIINLLLCILLVVHIIKQQNKLIIIRYFSICFFVFFCFSFYEVSNVIIYKPLFKDKMKANEISIRIFYMPSILLLDYSNWGFSDQIMKSETIINN